MCSTDINPIVDLSLTDQGSWLAKQVRSLRGYALSKPKLAEWKKALTTTQSGNSISIQFNIFRAQALVEQKRTDYKLRV